MPKGQPPKFKASVRNFPISETGSKCNSIFRHADSSWVIIMKLKCRVQLGTYFLSQVVFQEVQKFTLSSGWSKIP